MVRDYIFLEEGVGPPKVEGWEKEFEQRTKSCRWLEGWVR